MASLGYSPCSGHRISPNVPSVQISVVKIGLTSTRSWNEINGKSPQITAVALRKFPKGTLLIVLQSQLWLLTL